MDHVIRKIYSNYEKEENWLNEMSAKGMSLTNYTWGRYTFTETPKNEYTYRIELLENLPTHPESIAYIKFLGETGVEFVASYMRWIFLRKKSSEGTFDVYSDIESKIKHYMRINVLWITVMCLEFIPSIYNLVIGMLTLDSSYKLGTFRIANFNIFFSIPTFLFGLVFLRLWWQNRKVINKLKLEKSIRE
ncbi:DUF2812 domain-containing protein [Clostridium lacusfryxellense]|uniref:DUF2812 domain-containing protein n=1 Tax=Clostridium lacusfryxellense TaxID=205328 RepID=UPI001C0C463F|nr:DUF2812 domain-containing protein [Clostridium lacusfryxellense]MBU3112908.1 DUF2812 domain-containing protein [Clostridium lacusfryxellense]